MAHSTAPFVELTARSNFSFLQAGSSPEALVKRAHALGFDTLGLADRDGIYGLPRAYDVGNRVGVRVIVGCEVTLATPPYPTVWLHVEDATGYRHLCQLLTLAHTRRAKGAARPAHEGAPRNCWAEVSLEEIASHASGLWALGDASVPRVEVLHEAFGPRFSLRAVRHLDGFDDARERQTRALARRLRAAVCATNTPHYAVPEDKVLYDVMHCIREGCTLDQAGRALSCNAEAHLKSAAQMQALFDDVPDWLARAGEVALACQFSLSELKYRFPCESEVEGETPDATLRRRAFEGAAQRYPQGVPDTVLAQLHKELALIAELEVAPFFLSVDAIVRLARERDILCQGRGSAANSVVCYCLGITAVDPARANLLFERFLTANRREPPDIDVDFEHERREEVIQELYRRHGRERAAMVSEVISYRGRSALREVAKVFGLAPEVGTRMSDQIHWWDGVDDVSRRLASAGLDASDGRLVQVIDVARRIQGFPRHLSIHVGGFVLSAAPLCEVAPLEPATMPGRTVIPWDKDDIDILGFFKIDVLGLGMLTAIRKTMALARAQGAAELQADSAQAQLAQIPPEDARVYEALCRADTVGVFQIESRAQMSMLPRLKPQRFYDLVVEVAIVRPGPIQGGMVHPYLRRRMGKEPVTMPHHTLAPILERTFGVPIFQEQVMQLAIVGAGYTGAEADQLRRDMAAWRRNGRLERHREKLIGGFLARGISANFAERLYAQVQGFGEYGFPESHAASFALLVYASAWLKVHHPAAFAAALINSQPMGFYSPNTLLQDAERHGVELRPLCVLRSGWDCTLEPSATPGAPALRVGLRLVKGLRQAAVQRIEARRPFGSIEELVAKAALSTRDVSLLAKAGALDALEPDRRQAMWLARVPRLTGLLAGADGATRRAKLKPLARAEQLGLDFESTGVSVVDHPMKLLRSSLPPDIASSKAINAAPDGTPMVAAGLVICRQRPGTASGVVFVTLEDEFGFSNVVVMRDVFERFFHATVDSRLMRVEGRIEKADGVVHLKAARLTLLETSLDASWASSRDFH